MKKIKRVKDRGPYVVDESNRGTITERTVGVVMDNTISRNPNHHNKKKVNYFVTENLGLFCGNNTVAVFKIKERSSSETALQ